MNDKCIAGKSRGYSDISKSLRQYKTYYRLPTLGKNRKIPNNLTLHFKDLVKEQQTNTKMVEDRK